MRKTKKSYDEFKRIRHIGEHIVTLPEPPPIEEIANYDLPVEEQKFRPIKVPFNFDDLTDREKQDFVDEEYRKLNDGYWFFNNGNLEYITGHHYFYINWWTIKISEEGEPKKMGLPKFVDADRDFYYIWDRVEKAPKIAGLIHVTNRRDGKTYRACEIVYKRCLSYKHSHSGIQSKTDKDADALMGKMIESWQYLPDFFRPKQPKGNRKKNELSFKANVRDPNYKDYLNSWIDSRATTESAYDGLDLLTYLLDEAGKIITADAFKLLAVVLRTMVDGTTITGKCLVITTVEEMTKMGGEKFKPIWDNSDLKRLRPNGMTTLGTIRYFKPAYYGLRGNDEEGVPFIDEYGYTDVHRAKKYLERDRSGLSGVLLQEFKRQYPFTIEEAFQLTNSDSPFNLKHINETINYNNIHVNEDNIYRGNFVWKTNREEGIVEWIPDNESGKFFVKWFPDLQDRNKWGDIMTDFGRQRFPTVNKVAGGVDPFDDKYTTEKKNSNGALHLMRRFNSMDEKNSFDFILEYCERPNDPEIFYEDIIKACVFYSAEILVEKNKGGFNRYAERNGFYHYIMKRPEDTHTDYSKSRTLERGIATNSAKVRSDMIERLWSYTHNHLGVDELGEIRKFMPFHRTLQDWASFNVEDWTPYDLSVSSMLAIIAAEQSKYKKEVTKELQPLLRRYDNSRTISVPL